MVAAYGKLELSAGIEAALERIPKICKRDGYELSDAHLLVHDVAGNRDVAITLHKGEWCEVVGVGDAE